MRRPAWVPWWVSGQAGTGVRARLWAASIKQGAALWGVVETGPLFSERMRVGVSEAAMTKGDPVGYGSTCLEAAGRMGGEWVMSILRLHGESYGCLMPW